MRGVGYALRLPRSLGRVSLRARLIAALIVLAAAGLVTLAAVTYAEQRSFLLQRADQQARSAPGARCRSSSTVVPARSARAPGLRDPAPPRTSRRRTPDGRPAPGAAVAAAPATTSAAGHLRTATGRERTRARQPGRLLWGTRALPAPRSCRRTSRPVKPITVGSKGNGGLRYRVLAEPTHDQPDTTTVVAVPLARLDHTLDRLLRVEALVIGGVLVLLAALAWWVVRLGLRPLDRMGETADAIAAGDLSRRVSPATERTEVGRLGLALNAMLGQIEKAFAERRRARTGCGSSWPTRRTSCARRSPSIRGYAELFRIGAARKPADTEKAMRRIEDESARMGVLVEDLLTLARLDQVPEVARKPVDLAELAGDAADDARATAPDRAIELHADDGPVTSCSATSPSCARCSATCCATRSCTRRRARRSS